MKKTAIVLLLALTACGAESGATAPFPPEEIPTAALVGMFEGKFPCETCPKIKTGLVLVKDPATGQPTRYFLRALRSDIPEDREGRWRINRGMPSDPDAVVYELQPEEAGPAIHYLAVVPDILLLLDEQLNPRVGNATYSFTLNRTR